MGCLFTLFLSHPLQGGEQCAGVVLVDVLCIAALCASCNIAELEPDQFPTAEAALNEVSSMLMMVPESGL